MRALIPNTNPALQTGGYRHAHELLPMRVFLNGKDFDSNTVWAYFTEYYGNSSIRSFLLSDFYILDSEGLSPLEMIIYGIE